MKIIDKYPEKIKGILTKEGTLVFLFITFAARWPPVESHCSKISLPMQPQKQHQISNNRSKCIRGKRSILPRKYTKFYMQKSFSIVTLS